MGKIDVITYKYVIKPFTKIQQPTLFGFYGKIFVSLYLKLVDL